MDKLNAGTRAGSYSRVSDLIKQSKNYSLATQRDAIRHYCEQKGYKIVDEFLETYTSTEITRPELDKLFELARSRQIDVVVVHEPDRLTRGGFIDQMLIENEFKHFGVRCEYVLVHYDDTPEGQLQKNLRSAIDEFERKSIVRRTKRGRVGFAKSGKVASTRVVPFGFNYNPKSLGTPGFEINPEEAEIIRSIFEWFTTGDETGKLLSLQAIAEKLTSRKVPTAYDRTEREQQRKNPTKLKNHGVWGKSTIHRIINNELYAGVAHFQKSQVERVKNSEGKTKKRQIARPRSEWIAIQVPAIIDHILWETAQRQAQINSARSPRRTGNKYLLRALLTCSRCGFRFYSETAHTMQRYRCGGNKRDNSVDGKTLICQGSFRATYLEEIVWETVKAFLLQPDRLLVGLNAIQDDAKAKVDVLKRQYVSLQQHISGKLGERDRLIDLYVKELISAATFEQRDLEYARTIEELTTKTLALENQLDTVVISDSTLDDVLRFCNSVREGMERFTFEDKRSILEMLKISGVVQRGEKGSNDKLILVGYIPTTQIQLSNSPDFTSTSLAGCE